MNVGLGRGSEPELAIEIMGVGGRECPAAQPLQLGMGEHAGDQELAQATPAMVGRDEHVADIRVGSVVGDRAGEACLFSRGRVKLERQRVGR